MSIKSKSLLYLAIISLIQGSNFITIQISEETISPLTLVTLRSILSALILIAILAYRKQRLPPLGRQWLPFVFLGLVNMLLVSSLENYAETRISAGLTAVLISTVPIFTVIVAHFWEAEPLTRDRVLGIIIGFIGTAIVLIPGLRGISDSDLIGTAAVLLASFATAVAYVYTDVYLKHVDSLTIVSGMMICASFFGIPITFIVEKPLELQPSLESVLVTIFATVIGIIALLLYFWLIKMRSPTFASLSNFTVPPVALILGAILFGTPIYLATIIGISVILLCIAIMNGYLDNILDRSKNP